MVRTVSVKASLAPLTVFSTSGEEMDRFSPVLTSKATASPSENSTTQKPFTSIDAAPSRSSTRLATAL